MAYASVDDVKAAAGRLKQAFGVGDAPDDADIQLFLDLVAGDIDARLTALSISPVPTTDAVALAGLRPMNVDGALIRTLDATYPSEQIDKAAGRLLERAEKRYNAALKLLDEGKLAAVVALLTTDTDDDAGASNFWSEHPQYDLADATNETLARTRSVLPGIRKGMTF